MLAMIDITLRRRGAFYRSMYDVGYVFSDAIIVRDLLDLEGAQLCPGTMLCNCAQWQATFECPHTDVVDAIWFRARAGTGVT